jgi:hypothetical protein
VDHNEDAVLPRFQVIALSSLDPDGRDTDNEPKLLYPDAIKTAKELRSQGKAFRVIADAEASMEQRQSFQDLGAVE